MIFKIRYLVFTSLLILLTSSYLFAQIGGNSCATASVVNVNNCNSYSGFIPGLTAATYSNSIGTFCGGSIKIRKDTWLKFTTESTPATIPTTISITSTTYSANTTDFGFELYSSCISTTLACVQTANKTETLSISLTANTTYYIRLVNLSLSPNTMNVAGAIVINDVCIIENPGNDDIGGAIPISINASTCIDKKVPLNLATASTCAPAPACGNYGGTSVDLWYSVVVPASGNFFIQTSEMSPPASTGNVALAVYSSSVCGSATILGCSDSSPEGLTDPTTALPYDVPPMSMPTLYISGATASSTVYIRVWNENGYPTDAFNMCVNNMGPCGNLPNNDFCSNPASVLFAGATGTSVATNAVTGMHYTPDSPGDVSYWACLPTGDENAWYSFIATQNDVDNGLSIPFAADENNCFQFEAEIFDITHTINGCCANFTQVDNCDGWGAFTFSLTVDPNVLTLGKAYYLMINTYRTDPSTTCTFSITGWSASGVLPINFISFTGENNGTENILKWIVADDDNVKSYTLESSIDAVNFTEVENIDAEKFIYSANTKYKVTDKNPRLDLTYYRVRINTENGEKKYSNTISVYLRDKYENIYNIHPNPTTANLNFEYYSQTTNGELYIQLIGATGNLILDLKQTVGEGKNNITLPMSDLDNGVYILKVVSEKSGKTTHHKIIKN